MIKAGAIVVLLCLITGLAVRHQKRGLRLYEAFLSEPACSLFQHEVPVHLIDAVDQVATRAGFRGKWRINEPPMSEYLNIYLLRQPRNCTNTSAAVRAYLGTATYVGFANIIAIDLDFLERFAVNHELVRPVNGQTLNREIRTVFLWVLAHEVGHALGKHTPSHFSHDGKAPLLEPPVDESQRMEIDADLFMAKLIKEDNSLRLDVIRMLIDLLNFEIRRKLGKVPYGVGILYDYHDRRVVSYLESGTHPEFVYRATRLLLELPDAQTEKELLSQAQEVSQLLMKSLR